MHPSSKKAKKCLQRLRSLDNYYTKMKEANSDGKQVMSIVVNEADSSLNEELPNSPDQGSPTRKKQRTFSPPTSITSERSLRNMNTQSSNKENCSIFPEVPVRQSYKIFNPDILEELARLECVYSIPARVSRQVLMNIANNMSGQNWILLPDEKEEGEKNDGEERTEKPEEPA